MSKRFLILAVVLLGLLALPASALATGQLDNPKIDSSVQTVVDATGGDQAVPVIVYAPNSLGSVDAVIPLGVETTDVPLVDGVAASLTPDVIATLANQRYVTGIVADNPVFGLDFSSSMDITNLAIGLGSVASPARGGPSGSGVGVAVLDTGVTTNTDLATSRIVGWKDFVNGGTTPYDDAGHGTFIAGVIAGDGTASLPLASGGQATIQFRGVAPAANIVGIKVLDDTGAGRSSTLIAGIAWAIAHKDEYNIRVLNISIGGDPVGPASVDPVDLACEAAVRAGIVVVAAAGNEGDFGMGGVLAPGNDPYVVTVGATDTKQTASTRDDTMAAYSSWGPTLFDEYAKPDLVAPGNRVISLRVPDSFIDTNFPANLIPVSTYIPTATADAVPNYLMLSGTSCSTPLAAGAAALMLQQDPSLTPGTVKLRLMDSADPVAGASQYQEGAGKLDVPGALRDRVVAHGNGSKSGVSADLGNGLSILTPDSYNQWMTRVGATYGWAPFSWPTAWKKFQWTKFQWTKFQWTKFQWTKFQWTKFQWTKFQWTDLQWTKFQWTKFQWTILLNGQ
ncbi:MAG: S8 family peptidase [Actinomycetes bacterium]